MLNPKIAVFVSHPELHPQGQALAMRLNLPCIFEADERYDFFLLLTPNFLGLQKTKSPANPLFIDFLSGEMQYRRKHASLRKETLARALGLKTKAPKKIIDATAGLVRDSFILATLGFEVQVIERSPIIHALIEDAIKRATQDSEVGKIVNRMHLVNADATTWLNQYFLPSDRDDTSQAGCAQGDNRPDIIYLDPMFPPSKKSALSKQNMRIFHEVIGDDVDADLLLTTALTCATQRVVVKRPRLAQPLAGIKPTLSMEGSSNRFDIYLTRVT